MRKAEALRIFGLSEDVTQEELKKCYHKLMMLTHPDTLNEHAYPYDAGDINVAYEYLLEHMGEESGKRKRRKRRSEKKPGIRWNAPVNPYAYCAREIYHRVEDAEGQVIGEAVIDCDRFYWSLDEEFPLFLKSIYAAGKKILRDRDPEEIFLRADDPELLSSLSYLLAQQYVDIPMVLKLCAKEEGDGIYRLDAMLESDSRARILDQENLYPSRMAEHRLYVKREDGKELGYLSFKDDRLYYAIIPLFERRMAQVKMQVQGSGAKVLNRKRYREVALWIRLMPEDSFHRIESINLQIEELLKSQEKKAKRK